VCRNRSGCRVVARYMARGHQITIMPAYARVEVSVGGEKVAESDRAVVLHETGLPARYYLPREDVRTDLLRPTARQTTCPFKGQASYWSVQVGDEIHDDLVWSYQTPIPSAAGIAGLMCFYNERVELTIDGARYPGLTQCGRCARVPRPLSRIGPLARAPVARSIARPTAGGSGTRMTLAPLPQTRSTRWPCSSPRSPMSAPVASKIRRPSSPSMATRAKSFGLADSRAAVSRVSNCR